MTAIRTMVVLCPDWPVIAAGFSSKDLVAVVKANRVIACSQEARRFGVEVGNRRRSAQGVCPGVEIVEDDLMRNARAFEPIVAVLEEFCPQVGIIQPGQCAFGTRGPSRYFGGDAALQSKVRAAVGAVVEPLGGNCYVGIADGPFAANLAAQQLLIVPPDESKTYLSKFPVDLLNMADLTSLLVRLGIKTLGALAKLDEQTVIARFGLEGALAHRLASGLDATLVLPRPKDADLSVELELDPPAERVDIAAFAARSLGFELLTKLHNQLLTATIVAIEAQTDHGESHIRHWRFDDGLNESMLVDRLRWQLDGWLSGSSGTQPTAGISFVRMLAVEVVSGSGQQIGLWGEKSDADLRAGKGFARIQGQLGIDSVVIASVVEGRDSRERVQFTSWGQNVPEPAKQLAPWPTSVPSPSPTIVLEQTVEVHVLDAKSNVINVSGRGELSATPAVLITPTKKLDITACAGPWTHDDRWWDQTLSRRRAFVQLLDDSGIGYLVFRENGRWWLEGMYD